MTPTRDLREIEIEELRKAAREAVCDHEPEPPLNSFRGVYNAIVITVALLLCMTLIPVAIVLVLDAWVNP